jgi:hypothetical protein
VICRAEELQLFARKLIFDILGVKFVAVLLEDLVPVSLALALSGSCKSCTRTFCRLC